MSHAGPEPMAMMAGAPAATGRPALSERLAATPRLCCEALCRALGKGELEAALECFAPGACLVCPDGSIAQGEGALRSRLHELIARGAQVQVELRGVLVAADTALAHERWRLSDGDAVAARAKAPTMVLRCLQGEWKIAIAAPWGAPASRPLRAIWP